MVNEVRRQLPTAAPLLGEGGWGNAVYLGVGYWLTAAHVLRASVRAQLDLRPCGGGQPCVERVPTPALDSRDVAIVAEIDNPGGAASPTPVSRLDGTALLTVRGFLAGEASSREFSGRVSRERRPCRNSPDLRQVRLDPPATGSLRSLSGSGVFDNTGRVVGVVVEEDERALGGLLWFAPLSDWPHLWEAKAAIGTWVEAHPTPWRVELLDVRDRLLGKRLNEQGDEPELFRRDEILKAFRERRDAFDARGFLVLTGGAQQGKSGVIYRLFSDEWVQRSGDAVLACFGRQGADHLKISEALLRQMEYLLDEARMDPLAGTESQAGPRLMSLLRHWSDAGRRLTVYVDALDEINGATQLPFLAGSLPSGVVVVASLRHEPVRSRAIARSLTNPCLGWLNLDGGPDPDFPGERRLLPDQQVADSNAAVCDAIWDRWQEEDREPNHPLTPALRSSIRQRLEAVPGWNAYYANVLRIVLKEPGAKLPDPSEVPGPQEMLRDAWNGDVLEGSAAQPRLNLLAYGLVALARGHLRFTTLRRLLGNPGEEQLDRLLERVWRHVLRYKESDEVKLQSFHETWNELVRERLTGKDRTEVLRLLAYGTTDWPMDKADPSYDLQARAHHLLGLFLDEETPPQVRQQAGEDWVSLMEDPGRMARHAAAAGLDRLLADMAEGIRAGLPSESWRDDMELLHLYAGGIRRAIDDYRGLESPRGTNAA